MDVVSAPPTVLCMSILSSTAAGAISEEELSDSSSSSVNSEVGIFLDERIVQVYRIAAEAPLHGAASYHGLTPGRNKAVLTGIPLNTSLLGSIQIATPAQEHMVRREPVEHVMACV